MTGRRDQLHTIKQDGGLSGFLRRDESEYDTFGAGHASTSISAALGMAVARDRKGEDFHVCALIGDALKSVPGIGGSLRRAAKSVKDPIAAAVLPGALVNKLGFKYIGYVDGHNVPMLVRALEEAKKVTDGPVIVYALTTKGKGFPNPEKNYYAYHATGPFDPETGLPYKSNKTAPPTYTEVFGRTMCELIFLPRPGECVSTTL